VETLSAKEIEERSFTMTPFDGPPNQLLFGSSLETPTPLPERLTLSTMFVAKAFLRFKRECVRKALSKLHGEHFARFMTRW
jgi:hypothetical protein